MVRLSCALFALAGLATVSASLEADNAHHARAAAHNKMIKVRSAPAGPAPVPPPPNSKLNTTKFSDTTSKDETDWKRDDLHRFTFYETGQGACGGYNKDSDFIVALNSAQFGNGENCWKMINVWYNGKQTQAQIVDECLGCPEGALDMSPGLFSFFGDLDLGVLYGSWWF